MLAIGRALMGKPELLLLDEPSMGLAPLIVEQIFDDRPRDQRDGRDRAARRAERLRRRSGSPIAATSSRRVRSCSQGPAPELLADDRVRAAYLGEEISHCLGAQGACARSRHRGSYGCSSCQLSPHLTSNREVLRVSRASVTGPACRSSRRRRPWSPSSRSVDTKSGVFSGRGLFDPGIAHLADAARPRSCPRRAGRCSSRPTTRPATSSGCSSRRWTRSARST